MSEDKKDEGTAFADTRNSPLMGNDEKPTTDPQEFFERREQRKKKLLEQSEPTVATEDEVYTPRKDAEAQDGDKREYSVDDEYCIKEAKKQMKPHADEEKTPKSPPNA